jgi:hypothetical protein
VTIGSRTNDRGTNDCGRKEETKCRGFGGNNGSSKCKNSGGHDGDPADFQHHDTFPVVLFGGEPALFSN